MSDLERRPSYSPRRTREQRAYRLAMVGGGASVVAVVGVVLAILGVAGAGLPLVAAVLAAVCFVLFRRIVSPS
jgi:hydroxymethylglutaryl-CoA reductase